MSSELCTAILLSLCTIVEVGIAWLLILREKRIAEMHKRLAMVEEVLEKHGLATPSTLQFTRKIGG